MGTGEATQALSFPRQLSQNGYFLHGGRKNPILGRQSPGVVGLWITLCFGKFNQFFLWMLDDVSSAFLHRASMVTAQYLEYISREPASSPGYAPQLWISRRFPTVNYLSFCEGGDFLAPTVKGYWIASFQTCIELFRQNRTGVEDELTRKGFVYKVSSDRIAFSNLSSAEKGYPPAVYDMMRLKPHMIDHFAVGGVSGKTEQSDVEDYIAKRAPQCSVLEFPERHSLFRVCEPEQDHQMRPSPNCDSESD